MPEAQWLYINVVIFALQTGLRTDAGNTIRRERINQSDARLFNATIIVIARAEDFIAGGQGGIVDGYYDDCRGNGPGANGGGVTPTAFIMPIFLT